MKHKLLGALVVLTSTAGAQDKPALRVMVDGVGREAAECGIRKGALESVAARALKAHGIEVSTDAAAPYLYLNVNAYRVMQASTVVGCTTRIGASVRGNPEPELHLRGLKSKTGAYVVLCDAGRLLSGSQREVAAAVTKAFEEDIKACLGQLSY